MGESAAIFGLRGQPFSSPQKIVSRGAGRRTVTIPENRSGSVIIKGRSTFQVFIGFGDKSRGTDAEKNQIPLTRIGDSLATVRAG